MEGLLASYPPCPKYLKYGTAGFRDRADLPLDIICCRVGMFAASYSGSKPGGANCVGIMVTASHNAECDNGIKIVDADGGMLAQEMEALVETLANVASSSEFFAALKGVDSSVSSSSVIVVGRDTRPHSPKFVQCVTAGAEAMGASVLDLGQVTTPQLHFIVQKINAGELSPLTSEFSAKEALTLYNDTLLGGYFDLMEGVQGGNEEVSLVVDASNGVGSIGLSNMLTRLEETKGKSSLIVDLRNLAGTGLVNEACGAEHVQKGQVPPAGVSAETDREKMLCSFDGDADRIVFHSFSADGQWALLDGDKIACLLTIAIFRELTAAGLMDKFKFGIVQTAYANGGSTKFLQSQGVPVTMAKTGVKFLHHKALAFDIGVYFEANGHGTVLMSRTFLDFLEKSVGDQSIPIKRLRAFSRVINQAVGDAISDMLASLACLKLLNISLNGWHALYAELPSRQLKIPLSEGKKDQVKCTDDETHVVAPPALAAALQKAMMATPQGRCFVRPSGTEDVVRVYAEAKTQEAADKLAQLCIDAVSKCLE